MSFNRRQIGQYAEHFALQYLKQQGLVEIQHNFHSRYGEIDLIMLEQNCLCFVEVRARKRTTYATAAQSVTAAKQRKTILAAQWFLQCYPLYENFECRFDVMTIDYEHFVQDVVEATQQSVNIHWIKHAYTM
ncbi:MAG: YraN family protein [Acinetobacter sp.]|nr:MAG: YraN family protein [Acinetobacter sp.]